MKVKNIKGFRLFNESLDLNDINIESIFAFLLDIGFEFTGFQNSDMLDIKGLYNKPIIRSHEVTANFFKDRFKSISLYFKTEREIFFNTDNINDFLQVNDYLDKLGFEFQCIYHPSFFLYITDFECQEFTDIKWNKIVLMYKVK